MALGKSPLKVGTAPTVWCGSPVIHLGFSFPLLRSLSTGKKRAIEALWRDFFSNTSQWWDHRPEKLNPRFPDFKHKQTKESLWLADTRNPHWVQAELAAMPPGALQSNVFAWTQRLKRYVKAGQYIRTMEGFHQMQQERICPDKRTFLPVLNACAGLGALEEGKRVHTQIIHYDCEMDVYVATCLVDMYAKCGSIEDAWSVFNKMQEHDVVTWNAMIVGYVKCGQGLKAMELFLKMQHEGIKPDVVTFIGVLNACASLVALAEGRHVHEEIIQRGLESDVYVGSSLVDMYAKCGSIEDAWNVFSKMPDQNVVTWNTMLGGYVKSGEGLKAMDLFGKMQQEGVEPNAVTFVGILNACASAMALEEGRRVHGQIIQKGCQFDVYVANCLVDMYAKCGSMEDAWSVFNKMAEHNVVSWSAIIGGYVTSGQGLKAMELFREMGQKGVKPDVVTFVGVLKACASIVALEEGKFVHEQIILRGWQSDVYVGSCLVDMYVKCGSIEDAAQVFNKMPAWDVVACTTMIGGYANCGCMEDAWSVFNEMQEHDVVTWNTMIGGYLKSGQGLKATELFWRMQLEGIEPDAVTFVGVLNACASVPSLEDGRRVHEEINRRGWESDVQVGSCLVDMYAKCGSIENAWNVFIKMEAHDVVTWSALIGGYVKSGQGLKAIELFDKMQAEGTEPNSITLIGVLNACASLAALGEGRRVHEEVIRRGCEFDVYVGSSLVDMYAKCGSIEDAWNVFSKMEARSVVTWNAMIWGYAMHGLAEKAIGLFERMGKEGVEINRITFTCLLSACSHGGLVKRGVRYFKSMSSSFGILPTTEHYACMVDLFGRAGRLDDAEELAKRMSLETDVHIWRSLLGACRLHGNIKLAEQAAKECWALEPESAACHVLLSNIYAAAGDWDRSKAI